MAKILIVSFVILFSVYLTEQAYFLQKEYINKINEKATTWKAGFNFDPSTPKERIFKMLGSKRIQPAKSADSHMFKTIDIYNQRFARLIPKKFDARKRWRHCKRIGEVRDQGNCDSSWALATSSAFSDRFCIATHGEFNELLSAEELTFCCDACGEGCNGGSPIRAWEYFSTNGLVTGGNYNTSEGCQPYQVSPCPYDKNGNKTCKDKPEEVNHECKTRCFGDEEIEYYDDHKFTRDFYFLTKKTVQLDVLFRGPVEASFEAYDDFPSYKSGIYVKTENAKHIGSLSVKLIGWGEEKGVPYWLTVNSWGKNWGENGFFRIRRGTDECGIESAITGGVPVVD